MTHFNIRITGPDIDMSVQVRDEDDIHMVELALKKVRAAVAKQPQQAAPSKPMVAAVPEDVEVLVRAKPAPQPGDLDYPDSENTSTVKQ